MAARDKDDRPVLPDLIDTYMRMLLIVAIMGAAVLLLEVWDDGWRVALSPGFLIPFAQNVAFAAGVSLPISLVMIAEERREQRAKRRAASKARRD